MICIPTDHPEIRTHADEAVARHSDQCSTEKFKEKKLKEKNTWVEELILSYKGTKKSSPPKQKGKTYIESVVIFSGDAGPRVGEGLGCISDESGELKKLIP